MSDDRKPNLNAAKRIIREDSIFRLVGQGIPRNMAEMPSYDGIPCTCKMDCDFPCKGTCGCEAHAAAYGDAISELGCE